MKRRELLAPKDPPRLEACRTLPQANPDGSTPRERGTGASQHGHTPSAPRPKAPYKNHTVEIFNDACPYSLSQPLPPTHKHLPRRVKRPTATSIACCRPFTSPPSGASPTTPPSPQAAASPTATTSAISWETRAAHPSAPPSSGEIHSRCGSVFDARQRSVISDSKAPPGVRTVSGRARLGREQKSFMLTWDIGLFRRTATLEPRRDTHASQVWDPNLSHAIFMQSQISCSLFARQRPVDAL